MTDLKAAAEAAKAALPNMEWTAHMDRLHLVASPKGSTRLSDEVTLALCATGEDVYRVLPYLAAANPSAVLALYAERDEVREMYAREGRRAMIAEERASAVEASLASYKEEVMADQNTEFAWVIERGDSPPSNPTYWAGPDRWSQDHMDAIRFARQLDAVRVAGRETWLAPHRVCEHGWLSLTKEPPHAE